MTHLTIHVHELRRELADVATSVRRPVDQLGWPPGRASADATAPPPPEVPLEAFDGLGSPELVGLVRGGA